MTRTSRTYLGIVLICCGLLVSAFCGAAGAASTVTVSSMGNGVFDLDGADLQNAAAFDITFTYDAEKMGSPSVSQGSLVSGGMMAVNVNTPGTVRIALIRTTPVNGSGTIATITFTLASGSVGAITSLQVKLSDLDGKSVATLAQISNSSEVAEGTTSSATESSNSSQTGVPTATVSPASPAADATTASSTGVGMVVNEPTTTAETETAAAKAGEPAPEAGSAPAAADEVRTAKSDDRADRTPENKKNTYSLESVLARFRAFSGEGTEDAYCALFDREPMIGFRQKPAVALADGKSHVLVSFIARANAKDAPEVAMTNARLASLTKDPDNTNTWIADVVPRKGTLDVVLAVSMEDLNLVLPLTVAPVVNADLDRNGSVNGTDFSLFLKKRGTPAKPRFDLNRDGKRDAVDDYIFTANFLAASRSGGTASAR